LATRILLLCSCFIVSKMDAQVKSQEDTSLLNASVSNIIKYHNSVLGVNIHLYNGWQDPGYNHQAIGNPYFLTDEVQKGAVFYDDTYYPDVLFQYDLTQDNLVVIQYTDTRENVAAEFRSVLRMDLIKSKLGWFTMPGHEFVRLNPDSSSLNMPQGFYERMYNGRTKLFVKRTKLYTEQIKGNELERRYDPTTVYYIQKEGKYYNVRSQKSLLSVMKDKKKELSTFIRSNKKRFKKNKEQLFFETTRYYDQLTTH
jgi:hypothetical protein